MLCVGRVRRWCWLLSVGWLGLALVLVVECWVGCWVAKRMGGDWGVQCLDWCWGVLESMCSSLGSNNDEIDTEEMIQ